MMISAVLLVFTGLFVCGLQAQDCSNNQYTNGCSIPFNLPWFYKDEFTPDCHKHDICYSCGTEYGFSRSDCDGRFERNLQRRCELLNKDGDWLNSLHCKARIAEYKAAVSVGGVARFTYMDSPEWCSQSWVKLCL